MSIAECIGVLMLVAGTSTGKSACTYVIYT